VHDAPLCLDHEEHVVAAEEHCIDGEEVGGHDALGLDTEELDPVRSDSAWRWRKPMTSQDFGHAALGDCDPELLHLADDAQVAPARVLPG
jgi:hypothetical protein